MPKIYLILIFLEYYLNSQVFEQFIKEETLDLLENVRQNMLFQHDDCSARYRAAMPGSISGLARGRIP